MWKEIRKKKIHMKGCAVPRIFVSMLGWQHEKRGLIFMEGGEAKSVYISRKQRDFETYSSKVYMFLSGNLKELWVERANAREKLISVRAKIKELHAKLLEEIPDTVTGRRYEAGLKHQIDELDEQRRELMANLREIKITVEEQELAMFEMIHGTKSKAEALVLSYLQGAGMRGNMQINIEADHIAETLYQKYCDFDYMLDDKEACMAERDGETDEMVK